MGNIINSAKDLLLHKDLDCSSDCWGATCKASMDDEQEHEHREEEGKEKTNLLSER